MATTRKSTSRKSSVNKSNIPNEYFKKFNIPSTFINILKKQPNLYIALIADNPELKNLDLDFSGEDTHELYHELYPNLKNRNTINVRDKNNKLHTINTNDISKKRIYYNYACNKTDTKTYFINYYYNNDSSSSNNEDKICDTFYLRDFFTVEYNKKFSLGSSQKVITRKNKKGWFR